MHVRFLFFLFGARAEIVRRVLLLLGAGKFVRFQNFELLKISSPNNARYLFALRSLSTLYLCASHSTVVRFIPLLFGGNMPETEQWKTESRT